jgi:hypothetical protein
MGKDCLDCQVLREFIDELKEALEGVVSSERSWLLFKDWPEQLPKNPTIVASESTAGLIGLKELASNPQAAMEWALSLNDGDLKDMSYEDALRLRNGDIELPKNLKARPKTVLVVGATQLPEVQAKGGKGSGAF